MSSVHEADFLAPQSILLGRYVVLELVGSGGMGYVYKAVDRYENNRVVAIKEMYQRHLTGSKLGEAQELFQQEARLLGQLVHPNLPRVYNSFSEAGRSYLVMDFIEGETLAHLVHANQDQPLAVDRVLNYALQLCEVLVYLHQQVPPIIFRDLKPANVMVTALGHVYLIDFGIARAFKQGKQHDTVFFGSAGFCPPEQYGIGQTGPYSDLYSLGATLYYCLTARNPRENKPTLFDFRPARQDNLAVPKDVSELIQWLVATKEEQRPQSALQVRNILYAIQQLAADTTLDETVAVNPLYDPQTAYAAQFGFWMSRFNALPGQLGVWWSAIVLPWLATLYGGMRTWFFQFQQRYLQGSFSSLTFKPPVWTWRFITGWLLTLSGTLVGSLVLLNALHASAYTVAFDLSIVLLLLLLRASAIDASRTPLVHSILLAMALAVLFMCATLQSMPDVQLAIQTITLSQVLTAMIVALLIVPLLRFKRNLNWPAHILLALVAATYALLQYSLGTQALQAVMGWSPDIAAQVNTLALIVLFGVVAFALLRVRQPFSGGDRLQVLCVAVASMGLHLHYGWQEIVSMPLLAGDSQMTLASPANAITLNLLVAGVPAVIALLWLFIGAGTAQLGRAPLFFVAVGCILLQNSVGATVSVALPPPYMYPLSARLLDLLSVNQLLAYGLVGLVLLLFYRLRHDFTWIDRVVLYCIAIVCALLQSAVWISGTGSLQAAASQGQVYTTAINQLIAHIFTVLIIMSLIIITFSAFLLILRQYAWANQLLARAALYFNWLEKLILRFEHIIVLVTTITCSLLIFFLGGALPVLSSSFVLQQGIVVSVSQVLVVFLACASLLALVRLARPFGWPERFILLLDALSCICLFFAGSSNQQLSQALPNVQAWMLSPHIALPELFMALGLFVAILVSFTWLKRPIAPNERIILGSMWTMALGCAVLQGFSSVFVLLALVLLIQGCMLAMHIERILQTPLHGR